MRAWVRMPVLLTLFLPVGSVRAEPHAGADLQIHLDGEGRPMVPRAESLPSAGSRATVPSSRLPEQVAPGGGRMIVLDGALQKSLGATLDDAGRVRAGHAASSPDDEH